VQVRQHLKTWPLSSASKLTAYSPWWVCSMWWWRYREMAPPGPRWFLKLLLQLIVMIFWVQTQ